MLSLLQAVRENAVLAITLLISIPAIYVFAKVCYDLFLHPLRKYPGPLLWRVSGIPQDYHLYRGTLAAALRDLHLQYGPTVRTSPWKVSFTESQAMKDIYLSRPGRLELPRQHFPMPPNGRGSIVQSNKADHARFRRLLAHAFSERGLRSQEARIAALVDLLVDRLQERAGTTIDACAWYEMTTFDVVGDLAMSEPFGSLDRGQAHDWIPATLGTLTAGFKELVFDKYGLRALKPYLLPKQDQELRARHYSYTQNLIDKRTAVSGDQGDFWDHVMIKSGNEDTEGMTKPEMVNNASVLVLAGSETSATTLSAMTYLLLLHPVVMKKLTDEIRSAFRSSLDITIPSTAHLKYTFAVIEETLRFFPPASRTQARVVPEGGAVINGDFLPVGTHCITPSMAASFMPHNWHRASEFLPERWFEGPDADPQFAKDDHAAFIPFGIGIRNCIGRNLAYAEMRLIIAKVLWHFDLELDGEKTGDWFDQRTWAVWTKRPLWVKFTAVER